MSVGLAIFIDIHRNVVIETRENDKVLAWVSFSAPQAQGVAKQIEDLACLIMRDEQDAQGHRGRDPVQPLAPQRGPRPGRGYHEEDAEGNEEGA